MTKRKKLGAILLGAILALGVGAGLGASRVETGKADETILYETGFESSESFGNGTNYKSTVTQGPAGKQWKTYYGTVTSTASAVISGDQSLQMRIYNDGNIGYSQMEFDLSNVEISKVTFKAKTTVASGGVNIYYSTDSGNVWTFKELVSLTGTASEKTISLSLENSAKFRIKFELTGTAPSKDNKQLTIDDVKIYGSDNASQPATSVDVTAAGGAESVAVRKTLALSAKVNPEASASQTVTWSSSNDGVATVNSSTGLVTGIAEGDVTITAASTTPGITGSIFLSVFDPFINFDGVETFEYQTALGGSYSSDSFVGETGVTFAFAESRNEDSFGIDGKGLILRYADSYLEFTLPNGLSLLEFEYRKAYTGNVERQLDLLINGISVVTGPTFGSSAEQTIYKFSYNPATPHSGATTVKIKNVGTGTEAKQITIDTIVWKNGPELIFGTLDSISINTDAVKKSYYEGDSLSLNSLSVLAYDTAGEPKNVTSEITSDPAVGYVFKATDAGTKTITIYYTEGTTVSDSFDVTVLAIIQPKDIILNIGEMYTGSGDSGAVIALDSDIKGVFDGTKIGLLESAIVQGDVLSVEPETKDQSRVYYAGTNNSKGGIQPLKFGSTGGKGNVKFTFSDEINITKVTLYLARLGTANIDATMQVNGAEVQTIGTKSVIDVMHAPYEFVGAFGHELIVRNNSNIATYLYGIDIQTSTDEAIVDAFVDEFMFMDDSDFDGLGTGECTTLGIYEDAKVAFNALTPSQRALFISDAAYDAPRARLAAWAIANGDILNTSTKLLETPVKEAQNVLFNGLNDSNTIMLIVIISLIGVSVLGGVFYLRKREQN